MFAGRLTVQSGVGIDDDEAAGRIDERRIGEAQREVVGLAEQQDQVGARQHLGKCAERGIVDAARAFHAEHRDAMRLRERFAERLPARSGEHGPGNDQWPVCRREMANDLGRRLGSKRLP